MQLPAHLAERIREAVARHSSDFPIDEEARRHGAIALMGTIGAIPWLAELLPRRPPGARSCPTCEGSGFFRAHAQMACTGCRGLGWLTD